MQQQDLEEVAYTKLKPGEKVDLDLQFEEANELLADVKRQIKQLEQHQKSAEKLADIEATAKIEGLSQQLALLKTALEQQIADLQRKLRQVPPKVKKLFEKIEKDCSQYLAAVKDAGLWLYRGSSGPDEFVGKSWETRRAKDSSREAQVVFDEMLASLGFVALRGNSIFATSNWDHASGFGDQVYVIFPVNGRSHFTYTVSEDLTLTDILDVGVNQQKLNDLKIEFGQWLREATKDVKKKPKWLIRLLDYSKPGSWWSWNSIDFELKTLDKKGKIQLDVPDRFMNVDQRSLVDVESFVRRYHPKNTDLATALKNMNEVYISGVYYALSVEKYANLISNYFGVEASN